jgi:hypothetical protein
MKYQLIEGYWPDSGVESFLHDVDRIWGAPAKADVQT